MNAGCKMLRLPPIYPECVTNTHDCARSVNLSPGIPDAYIFESLKTKEYFDDIKIVKQGYLKNWSKQRLIWEDLRLKRSF